MYVYYLVCCSKGRASKTVAAAVAVVHKRDEDDSGDSDDGKREKDKSRPVAAAKAKAPVATADEEEPGEREKKATKVGIRSTPAVDACCQLNCPIALTLWFLACLYLTGSVASRAKQARQRVRLRACGSAG